MKPVFLHAANPGAMTGDGNWTYLIGGTQPLLIDAGVGSNITMAILICVSISARQPPNALVQNRGVIWRCIEERRLATHLAGVG